VNPNKGVTKATESARGSRGFGQRLGTAKSKNVTLRSVLFDNSSNLNRLSLARLFLFGSRDLWFEVPLPFYLRLG
jgi:hypothetical protein